MSGVRPHSIASLLSFDLRTPTSGTARDDRIVSPPYTADSAPPKEAPESAPFASDDGQPQPTSKRRRLATTDFTRRKRAATACQFCRVRKTKCDNVRPQCGYCVRHQAKCVYGDADVEEPEATSSETSISNEQLMGRLDEIKDMLQRTHLAMAACSTPSTTNASLAVSAATPSRPADMTPTMTAPWKRFSSDRTYPASEMGSSGGPGGRNPIFSALRCESLLRWPCLASVVPEDVVAIDSLALSAGYEEKRRIQGADSTRGISEEAVIPLCKKFLFEVHPRNPVLDESELMRHARAVVENGFKWDSASCLVLLACALAAYTTPWIKPVDFHPPVDDHHWQASIDAEDQAGAESYYIAAQKRMGFLGNAIQDIQCFFFATIFEKFSMRPLRAWFHVQQACNRLEARLLQRGERPGVPFQQTNPDDYHLEQRLFWSCFRAESELVFELGLNPSGLENFLYPDAFPSPPDDIFGHQSPDNSSSLSLDEELRQVKERGWCYYLAEISVRRTVDETLSMLYGRGESFWLKNPAQLVRQYHECEQQISSWHYHIPAVVQYTDDVTPDEEFASALQGRANVWREYALRPVLYYVLHTPADQQVAPEAELLATKELKISAIGIYRMVFHRRHGGTWLICRKVFTAACVIIAGALHQDRVEPPHEWPSLIILAIQFLQRWGRDASDIGRMADILKHMYQRTCREVGRLDGL